MKFKEEKKNREDSESFLNEVKERRYDETTLW